MFKIAHHRPLFQLYAYGYASRCWGNVVFQQLLCFVAYTYSYISLGHVLAHECWGNPVHVNCVDQSCHSCSADYISSCMHH